MPDRDVPVATGEADRVVAEFSRRDRELPPHLYEPSRAANLFRLQQRMRWAMALLDEAGLLPLVGRRILEVGCGDALWLAEMAVLGARREDLAGIDLGESRIGRARERFGLAELSSGAGPDLRVGDAIALPWADGSFDVVMQSTVFSSILSPDVQALAAREMCRVLSPRGVVLWYDFSVGNPRNPNLRGIGLAQLRRLFPGCAVRARAVCLPPPLARRVVPRSWLLASMLEAMRLINCAYIATIHP